MAALSISTLLRISAAIEQMASKMKDVSKSFLYILVRRMKVETFGREAKVSAYTWGKITYLACLLAGRSDCYTDKRYQQMMELIKNIENQVWAGRPREELDMILDVELVRILNGEEPEVVCEQCGKKITGTAVVTSYGGVYCSQECADDFTHD